MSTTDRDAWLQSLPKAELHLHVEGTLEPEMMLALAERNRLPLPFPDVEAARRAYRFGDLQSFLDLYYAGAAVLRTEQDFHDLCWAYLTRARADGVRHVELFFDPQTHTARGVAPEVFVRGLPRRCGAASGCSGSPGGSSPASCATCPRPSTSPPSRRCAPSSAEFAAFGLDSSERGFPPELFREVFARVRAAGLKVVAHAGEEGPPSYVSGALDPSARSASTTGCAARRTRRSSSGSAWPGCRSPSARSPTWP